MRKMPRFALGLIAALIIAALVTRFLATAPPASPIYTVAQVAAGLAHHPRAWYGRTITVRGVAMMAEWNTQGPVPLGGTIAESCLSASRCAINVPQAVLLGTPVHLYLVDRLPQRATATMQLASVLIAARARWPITASTPPNFVLLVRPRHIQPVSAVLAYILRSAPVHLPASVGTALAQLPVITDLVQSPTIGSGGIARLYRVRLLLPSRPLAGTSLVVCKPACDDAVLLDTLSLGK